MRSTHNEPRTEPPFNVKGAQKRCYRCVKLVNSTRPCKSCGSVMHIVAIVTSKFMFKKEDIDVAMKRARLKALRQWRKQAGLSNGQTPVRQDEYDLGDRATVIFDFDGDRIVTTFYMRTKGMRYPS